jgi:WD40 repeat protein
MVMQMPRQTAQRPPLLMIVLALLGSLVALVTASQPRSDRAKALPPALKLEHAFKLSTLNGPVDLQFSADGRLLFELSGGHLVGWRVRAERAIFDQGGHCENTKEGLGPFAVTPDGRYLVTGGSFFQQEVVNELKVYELLTGHLAKRCKARTGLVRQMVFDPRGKRFAAIGEDGYVYLWEFPSCKEVRRLRVLRPSDADSFDYAGLLFMPRGNQLLVVMHYTHLDRTGGPKEDMRATAYYYQLLWDTDAGKYVWQHRKERPCDASHVIYRSARSVSADSKLIAGAMAKRIPSAKVPESTPADRVIGWVRLWDVATGKKLFDLPEQKPVSWLAFHPDGRHLLMQSGLSIVVWDVQKRRQVVTWQLPERLDEWGSGVSWMSLSPSGQQLATVQFDGLVRVWRIPWDKLPR